MRKTKKNVSEFVTEVLESSIIKELREKGGRKKCLDKKVLNLI